MAMMEEEAQELADTATHNWQNALAALWRDATPEAGALEVETWEAMENAEWELRVAIREEAEREEMV
jgi:hypothetical protein